MKKRKNTGEQEPHVSPFKGLGSFQFEEDFIEENVRCIPMIVRFKMDAAGIKLKLAEWSKFQVEERVELALKACDSEQDAAVYKEYLGELVQKYTGEEATAMEVDKNPLWADDHTVPVDLQERAKESGNTVSLDRWKGLSHLQRFALLKLCRPGHESKNFIKALKEFGIA